MPAGFPPAPLYELDDANRSSTGIGLARVVHDRRLVREVKPHEVAVGWGGVVQDAFRAWLCALGGARTRFACTQQRALSTYRQSEGALRRVAAPLQRAIERDFAAMVAELQAWRVLLRDEARRARPSIHVVLIDERSDRSRALPDPKTLLAPRPERRTGR